MIRLRPQSTDNLSDAVMAVILDLDKFFESRDKEVLADARKRICDIAGRHNELTVANSLWRISLKLQRELGEK